jgi:hypothetical protein
MATIYKNYYGSIGKINLLPLRAVSFHEEIEDTNLTFFNLEAESSFKFTPKTRQRTDGTIAVLGYDYEGNFYIPHNELQGLTNDLAFYINRQFTSEIVLGNSVSWTLKDPTLDLASNILLQQHNATANTIIFLKAKMSFAFEVESIELRPRTIIRQKGFIPNNDLIISTFTT